MLYIAPPRVTFNPPSVNGAYEVELGRGFSLRCSWDVNVFPHPGDFRTSALSQRCMCTLHITHTIITRIHPPILHVHCADSQIAGLMLYCKIRMS